MILNSPYISGSLTVTGNIIASGSITLSGSVASASYAASASNALSAQTASTTPNAVVTASISGPTISFSKGDASTFTVTVNNVTSASYSNDATLAANSTLLNSTASTVFATTGSNTLTGTQYISNTNDAIGFSNTTSSIYTDGGLQVTKNAYFSSSMFVKGNLTVYGTQSVSFITSSQLNISTNLITVNTDTPSIRFGGLAVYDSGSTGLTGSILWDSQDNQWIYSNPSGSEYDSSVFLVGPRSTGSLGNEVGITTNALAKGDGAHHMTSSGIFEVSGSVGIGTSSPTTTLHISGTTGGLFEVDGAAAINALFVSASGRVGIGTTNPQQILNVYSPASSDQSYLIMAQTSGAAALFTARTSVTSTYFGTENSSAGSTINGTLANASLFANQSATALQLGTNNNIRLTITNSGSVGIGITSPSSLLHVNSGTTATQTIANFAAANYGSPSSRTIIQIGTQYEDGSSRIVSTNTTGNQSALIFQSHAATSGIWNDAMYISGGGEVGIGTTSPSGLLHLSNSNPQLFITNTQGGSSYYMTVSPSIGFNIYESGVASWFTIKNGGNVGIGTTNPSYPLHISAFDGSFALTGTRGTGTTHLWYTSGVNNQNLIYNNPNGDHYFYSNSTPVLSITTNKYVGIGLNGPTNLFHVEKSLPNEAISLIYNTSSTGYGLVIQAGSTTRYALAINDYLGSTVVARFLANGITLLGTATSNASMGQTGTLQVAGGVRATSGLLTSIEIGTIAQNTTTTVNIDYNGLYLITNGGNNSALIMFTRGGGSRGAQLISSTNSNNDIVVGTTSEPSGGNYLRIWSSAVGVFSIKNVNAYTGPYSITAISTQ